MAFLRQCLEQLRTASGLRGDESDLTWDGRFHGPQRRAPVYTGASPQRGHDSSSSEMVTEQPAVSSEVT